MWLNQKCNQKGEHYASKVIYPPENTELRTNYSFRQRLQPDHHHTLQPIALESLNFDIVKQIPFDYMHVVCLGVTKTLLKLLAKSKGNSFSFSSYQIKKLNESLDKIKSNIPFEFSRTPRNTIDLDRWKATELRQFLLYTGPLVLKSVIDQS